MQGQKGVTKTSVPSVLLGATSADWEHSTEKQEISDNANELIVVIPMFLAMVRLGVACIGVRG
eukprot:1458861-Amphidinium_carterae.1